MKPDYSDLEKLAAKKEDDNWRFRSFLKFYDDKTEEQIDALVFKITDEVWSGIDCTKCGRCCMKEGPLLSDKDQERLAKGLKITVEELKKQYLEYDEEDEPGWRIKDSPCPFLKDKKCTVYEFRPENCREYPYLHKPDFNYRTWGMVERTFTCPIVFQVMEELKARLRFHYPE